MLLAGLARDEESLLLWAVMGRDSFEPGELFPLVFSTAGEEAGLKEDEEEADEEEGATMTSA